VTAWDRLRTALDDLASSAAALPEGGRFGAALALLRDPGDGDLEIVYTRRRDDLAHHPGQISFPGGRVEVAETPIEAALREAEEEVGLQRDTVDVIGRLPAFYIPPSRFWLQTVIARWCEPHRLLPAEAEVAEVLHVRTSQLRDAASWRVVQLSAGGHSWAWQLDDRHLLWGATAIVTSVLLGMLDPDWHGGTDPAALSPEREVRPWEGPQRAVPVPGRARVPGLPELPVGAVPVAAGGGDDHLDPLGLEAAGAAAAEIVRRLDRHGASDRPDGPVVVLVGPGGNGAAGMETALQLAASDTPVEVALARPGPGCRREVAERLVRFEGTVHGAPNRLPQAAVVVDALVGGGLRGPLEREAMAVVHALRHQLGPVVSIDVPSGIDPQDGLVGDTVAADITLALGEPRRGLFLPGLGPFVGDLYLADLGDAGLARQAFDADAEAELGHAPLVRLVAGPHPAVRHDVPDRGRWRE
jgi:hydroxyethylthiazole kinase-like uncharacterized protein yjeF